jgi:hypothetical protein
MARNNTSVSQVVNDFILSHGGDDWAGDVSDYTVRSYALRGLRDMGFDMLKRVRSLKLPVSSNSTVVLPEDYVDWSKVGVVGTDGLVYVLSENKHINMSQKYSTDASGNKYDSNGDGLYEREDDRSANNSGVSSTGQDYSFSNFLQGGGEGRLYGAGGGNTTASFRINYDQNRIELETNSNVTEIVLEYIADEALSNNPTVHIYAEDSLHAYIYYRVIERKSAVPVNEKARARAEYYNERRKSNARMNAITKEDLLRVTRKNFKQSPKI